MHDRAAPSWFLPAPLPLPFTHPSAQLNDTLPPWRGLSALKTQALCSKVSNKQAVFLKAGASSGTVWQFQKTTHGKDGRVDRILGVGSPVFAGIEVRRLMLLLLSVVDGDDGDDVAAVSASVVSVSCS